MSWIDWDLKIMVSECGHTRERKWEERKTLFSIMYQQRDWLTSRQLLSVEKEREEGHFQTLTSVEHRVKVHKLYSEEWTNNNYPRKVEPWHKYFLPLWVLHMDMQNLKLFPEYVQYTSWKYYRHYKLTFNFISILYIIFRTIIA